jgi:hypothetical protein
MKKSCPSLEAVPAQSEPGGGTDDEIQGQGEKNHNNSIQNIPEKI